MQILNDNTLAEIFFLSRLILYEVPKFSVLQSDIRAPEENRLRSTDVPALPASLGLKSAGTSVLRNRFSAGLEYQLEFP